MPERKSPARNTSGSGRKPSSSGSGARNPARNPAAKSTPKDTPATEAAEASTETPAVSTSKSATAAKTTSTAAKTSTAARSGAAKKTASGRVSSSSAKSAGRPGGKPSGRPSAKSVGPAQRPPNRKKKNKSIVNQKQRPWGLIITTIVVVAFAAAVVGVVVATHKSGGGATASKGGQAVSASDAYRHPELAAAAAIKGVSYRVEGQHTHVEGHITYDSSPPVGGDHSQYWADCTGTVYKNAIANENAVHMLEHGAIWITYDKSKLSSAQVATLAKNVSGIDRMAMSPYPNLKSAVSLQAWGYQLFVSSPTDPRIAQFISALKYNQQTTPEYGATCSQPSFKNSPSTYGNPLWVPKNGSSGNVTGA